MSGLKSRHPEKKEPCGGTAEIGTAEFGTGLSKTPEPDDPMSMEAELVSGDPLLMLDCLIEEFARLGWDAKRIGNMFENPFFLASHGLAQRFGQEAVRERIQQTLRQCGVYRFKIIEPTPVGKPSKPPIPATEKPAGQ